ncbi:MAG: fimbrillin family protein, partial [Prevotellaceae bacterium]|nr:fimbrillin family protein [Candidatus Colivivens equi]
MIIQDMKLRKCVYLMCSAMMTFLMVGCTQNEIPEVYPDGTGQIRFGVDGISEDRLMTRASSGYHDWNATSDPQTMGAFGFCGGEWIEANKVFDNKEIRYNSSSASSCKWEYSPLKYWGEYFDRGRMDFLAYMPYKAGVTLTNEGNEYSINFPEMPGYTLNANDLVLACHTPVGYEDAYNHFTPVPMQFDQVYNKFDIQFKLDPKMAELRTLRIVKVEVTSIPKTVTISQKYTFADNSWAKGAVVCTPKDEEVEDLVLQYRNNEDTDWEGGIRIGYCQTSDDRTKYTSFGKPFYMVPISSLTSFEPELKVTYIVYDEDKYE